jgi:DNA-binding MurR/RpiR family transcriptional regulator
MKYITLIESFYPGLTKSEKKVADYIIREKEQILHKSLIEMSENCKVGEATFLRFCYKIGLQGVQHLKFIITKENGVFKDQSYENYVENIQANIIKVVNETKLVIDPKELNKAIELINQFQNITFFAVGSSGGAALEAESRFLRVGKITRCIIDSHFQLMHSSLMTANNLVIAISLSGNSSEVIEAVKLAKANKAKIIAITNYIKSPLCELADVYLLTAGRENLLDGGSLIAKISQLYVIDLICTGYILKEKKKAFLSKEKTGQAVLSRTWQK